MAPDSANESTARQIIALFEKQNRDGTYRYSDREVRNVLPLLVLSFTGKKPRSFPPALQKVMHEFTQSLGIPKRASADELRAVVQRHYAQNPPPPQLVKDFAAFIQRAISQDNSVRAGKSSFDAPKKPVAKKPEPKKAAPKKPLPSKAAKKPPGRR